MTRNGKTGLFGHVRARPAGPALPRVLAAIAVAVGACDVAAQESGIAMGDGASNWIRTAGAQHNGATLVFPEALIDGPGWLVLHPFRDGQPDGTVVAGYAPLPGGAARDIAVDVEPPPQSGDRYIVMLHSDANGNGEFDFVFINEREVVDKAVFEGSTMIGYVYAVP